MEILDDLSIALRCSDRAAELAQTYFEAGAAATLKADGSPVTEADPAVEVLLKELIGESTDGDAFLGEELGREGSSERVWILDPIDGTSLFTKGDPNWRVHVALEVGGELEVAVVTSPALGVQWWAVRGQGAFESQWPRRGDKTPLAVRRTSELSDAVLDALNDTNRQRLPQTASFAPPAPQGWCSGLIGLVRGEVDCFLAECCQIWDHAPWILLIEEAGGRFTNPSGGNGGDQNGGLYSTPAIHAELLAAIGYPAASSQ